MIRIEKSVYDRPEPSDGKRVLVMTIWPRGVSKEKVDAWLKELGAPRPLIQQWKRGRISWRKFAEQYKRSLRGKESLLQKLAEESRIGTVTLLCWEKDPTRCHRSLLMAAIEEQERQKRKYTSPRAPERGSRRAQRE